MGRSKDIVEALIRAGADVDGGPSHSALMGAVFRGHNDAVEVLLASGSTVTRTSSSGLNALHLAAFTADSHAAKMLLAAGADPNEQTSKGDTALHFAAREVRLDLVRMLCDAGARTAIVMRT